MTTTNTKNAGSQAPANRVRISSGGQDTPDVLLTLSDVSAMTQLSRRKIQVDMASGALAFVKFGRSTRFKREDVVAYIEARRIAASRDGFRHSS